MPDIAVFTQHRGKERVWVPEADVEWWLRFWGRQGVPACRWRDYREWGGRFYPLGDEQRIRANESLRPVPRRRTNYRLWRAPE